MSASSLLARFSNCGPRAKIKLVIVGSSASTIESVKNQLSSLITEHVSPTGLMRQEISRHTPLGQQAEVAARRGQSLAEETIIALMRRWFWTRKPDAGFAIIGFPATLLQAKVFDEWLEARDETLDAVIDTENGNVDHTITSPATNGQLVINHYRTQGVLVETLDAASVAVAVSAA